MKKKIISFALSIAICTGLVTAVNAADTGNDTVAAPAAESTMLPAASSAPESTSEPEEDIEIKVEEKVLTKDIDYKLTYYDNINAGTARVVVTFIGNYAGEMERTFNIKRQSSGGGGGGGGGSSRPKTTPAPKPNVTDGDGNSLTNSTNVNGNHITITVPDEHVKQPITVILPDDKTLTDGNDYEITIVNKNKKPLEGVQVIVKDKNNDESHGITDKNGTIIVPDRDDTVIHSPYIKGYTDGTFSPDGNITRAETAAMLSRVMPLDNTGGKAFSDVSSDVWYYEPIMSMSSAGIIMGYTDGTFKPDNNITRAEFVAMLMRNLNVQTFDSLPFTDVSSDLWSADYIYSAYTAGYINGYEDGSFRPDSPITRAEAVKIINGVLGRSDFSSETNPFSDVSDTHWAYTQILEAAVEHQVKK